MSDDETIETLKMNLKMRDEVLEELKKQYSQKDLEFQKQATKLSNTLSLLEQVGEENVKLKEELDKLKGVDEHIEIVNEIDNVKEKLTDKEYQDLLQATHKAKKKKDELVKIRHINAKSNIYIKYSEDGSRNYTHSSDTHIEYNGFDSDEEEELGTIKLLDISPIKYNSKVYHLKVEEPQTYRASIDVDESYIEKHLVKQIKEKGFVQNEKGVYTLA
jgi:hypothetical protein